jgi:Ca-activated chloride channel family protein
MWLLVMPLDRWLFQGLLKMPINLAGKLALGNAFFWSAATPLMVCKLYQVLEFALPFIGSC